MAGCQLHEGCLAVTNTYAINTVRNKEFEVAQELSDLGLPMVWCPIALASKYLKQQREYKFYDRAYISKLIFAVIPAIYYSDAIALKHVIGKPLELNRYDCKELGQFRARVEAEYEDARRKQANSEYRCQFEPGQALEVVSGVFADKSAIFRGLVEKSHDEYAKLKLELELMGRPTFVEIDPDMVRAG